MSLEQLKTSLIESISNSNDEVALEQVLGIVNDILEQKPSTNPNDETIWAAITIGREQVAKGESGSLDDLDFALQQAIVEGKEKRKNQI